LRAGGNAVDAAVAAAFASFVAEPSLVSVGGGGYALVYRPGEAPQLYDFFCAFPGLGAAEDSRTTPLDFFAVTADFGVARQEFHIGRASVATPGIVAGLCRLHGDAGRRPLADVLQPAIDLARGGVPLGAFNVQVGRILAPILRHTPDLARLFGAPDAFLSPAHPFRHPQLAETLAALARSGPELFYGGAIAQAILADQRQAGGLLTERDLTEYQVILRPPLHWRYRGFDIFTNPPPARGGALIAFSLALLEDFDLGPVGSPRRLRLLAEVMRQTNLARPALEESGDAGRLLAPDHIAAHRAELSRRLARPASPAEPAFPPGPGHTSHISVLDGEGAVVSLTTTAGEGAGFVVPGAGLLLNNMLGEADLHPHGFHKGRAGERIGSMMAPTLVLHRDRPVLALGSGGSNRLRTAILQVLLNVLDDHLPLDAAVAAPRIHFEDGVVQVEGGHSGAALGWLRRWDYELARWPGRHMFFGGVHAVGREATGDMAGAGDDRRSGAVARVG
jgi:gamma-glutamyltranspeptidase/glutathione hydrolase